MNTLEELFNNRWIIKSDDKEKYYKIKDDCIKHKKFLSEKLGYQLIVNPYLIKLEKLPGKAEPFMGISEFTSPEEYSLLCIILMFLEDKGFEEQFVLSQLTEYIQVNYTIEKLDWTIYSTRKNLVKVIKFCIKNGLFKVTDGEEDGFARDMETEVLYESSGISRYFARNFTKDIMDYAKPSDFEKSEWIDLNEDRGMVRRQRVYRKLLMSLGVYKINEEDEDFIYIKHFRHIIERDMDEIFNCDLHIHKSSAYLIAREDTKLGKTFPENSNISDIVLLLNSTIYEDISNKLLLPNIDEIIKIDLMTFENYIITCKNTYSAHWGKTYKDKSNLDIINEITIYMSSLGLIDVDYQNDLVNIYPIVGKLTGKYPASIANSAKERGGEGA